MLFWQRDGGLIRLCRNCLRMVLRISYPFEDSTRKHREEFDCGCGYKHEAGDFK